jgi:hypothetical protein
LSGSARGCFQGRADYHPIIHLYVAEHDVGGDRDINVMLVPLDLVDTAEPQVDDFPVSAVIAKDDVPADADDDVRYGARRFGSCVCR